MIRKLMILGHRFEMKIKNWSLWLIKRIVLDFRISSIEELIDSILISMIWRKPTNPLLIRNDVENDLIKIQHDNKEIVCLIKQDSLFGIIVRSEKMKWLINHNHMNLITIYLFPTNHKRWTKEWHENWTTIKENL